MDSDSLGYLSYEDTIAGAVRQKWIDQAWDHGRNGKQLLPQGDWNILLWRAGRGFGKTYAESQAMFWEAWRQPNLIGHYLAATLSDVRGTIFEGPAGICSVVPPECLLGGSLSVGYNKSLHELRLCNGSVIRGFATTESAERLRGPQCHFLCGDELAAWDRPAGNLEEAFNNAMLGVRLPYPDGTPARAVFGTTPKPRPFLKRLEKRPDVRVVTGTSRENLRNLSSAYVNTLMTLSNTAIGKQEIEGQYIDEEDDQSIFKRRWFQLWQRERPLPQFEFILEVYDPALSEHDFDKKRQTTDPTACIVLGVFNLKQVFGEAECKQNGWRSRRAVLLLDAWDERLGFPELLDRARTQHRIKWGGEQDGRRSDLVLIEAKASGLSLRQSLAKYGVPSWPYNPGRMSKTMRAHAASPVVSQKMVFIPESSRSDRKGLPRDWCEPLLEQVCGFWGEGTVEHDDYVDCLTSGIIYLKDRGMLEINPEQKFVDYEDEMAQNQAEAVSKYEALRIRKIGNPYA